MKHYSMQSKEELISHPSTKAEFATFLCSVESVSFP
jgi:hypothetical protein